MLERITPMVKNLLILNIGIFFFSQIYSREFITINFAFFNPLLPNSPDLWNPFFKPWQFLTYMFLHGSLGHLFSNMFGLYMFGSILESFMGSKRFLLFYLICGFGAAFLNTALDFYTMSQLSIDSEQYIIQAQTPMVGASGAIFGILMAFGFLFPNLEMMLLFFPFPIKAKYFVAMYGIYELVQGTAGLQTGIAHFAHIGGLITAFILLKFFGFSKQNYY